MQLGVMASGFFGLSGCSGVRGLQASGHFLRFFWMVRLRGYSDYLGQRGYQGERRQVFCALSMFWVAGFCRERFFYGVSFLSSPTLVLVRATVELSWGLGG